MNRNWLALGTGILMAFSACADDAEVFRWKDREGRINYGNMPPPGVDAEPVGGRGRLTVVPAPVLPPAPPPPPPESRLDRLERELEAERQLRLDAEAAEQAREIERAQLKAECEARYREPCSDDGEPAGKRYIVVPPRPFPHLPGMPTVRPLHRDAARDAGSARRDQASERASRRDQGGGREAQEGERRRGAESDAARKRDEVGEGRREAGNASRREERPERRP
ncbi:hypothetical protein CEW87_21635 [Parazoarcus communis]|uniref:DUF4124 domain-containing protein n=1 Tax=Parazoarcus communis TaxID=41977 RepID=A0A2U8H7Q9_9RHOO|nr:DUF4124 domain-containing protein [Parazoarcus communis]AWI81723.1 hypothetical protein CEW87_21635 [Parazoarcus communis]